MKLTEVGESRVRGYLFVLGRSLRSFLPREVADDAVREVESHIRERVAQIEVGAPGSRANGANWTDGANGDTGERELVERVLAELGPPLRVAQAYSTEMTLDEAETTGRLVPMARAIWHLATTSVLGFLWAIFVFTGWTVGLSFLTMAVLKPIFPNNVGLITVPSETPSHLGFYAGEFHSLGVSFGLPPDATVHGGYWIIPVCLVVGLAAMLGTHRASRRILSWLRSRRAPARFRVRVEVK